MRTGKIAFGLALGSLLTVGSASLCIPASAAAEETAATASEQATRQYLVGVTGMT